MDHTGLIASYTTTPRRQKIINNKDARLKSLKISDAETPQHPLTNRNTNFATLTSEPSIAIFNDLKHIKHLRPRTGINRQHLGRSHRSSLKRLEIDTVNVANSTAINSPQKMGFSQLVSPNSSSRGG